MPTISLGKVALKWRGAYNAGTAYNVQDVVSYNGSSYICKVASTGNAPSDTTKWDLMAQGVEGIATNSGDLLYFNGSNLTRLPAGNTGSLLRVGSSGLPEWQANQARSGMRAVSLIDSRANVMYRRGCSIMSDGSVRWWGRGESNVLGQGGTTSDRSYPVRVGFPTNAQAITKIAATYDASAFAISVDGHFWSWGANSYGQLGTGDTTARTTPYDASTNSSNSIFGKTVIDYAPMDSPEGYESTLVLCSDGTMHACGYNAYGQLGTGDTTQRTNFIQVAVVTGITKIARGRERYTSCYALKSDGTVYSWGYNNEGQLGHGDATQRNIPTLITYFSNNNISIVDIGCGGGFAWAIDDNDNLYTWGYNGYGNLGRAGTTNQSTPAVALTDVASADASPGANDYSRMYAIKTDGSVWAAGDNSYGCLGVAADTTDRSSFQQCLKSDGSGFTNATKVLCGGTGSYNNVTVLQSDGTCFAVGYSGNGNIGTGNYNTTNYWFQPVLIHRRLVTDIAVVGTGAEASYMYLMDDGQVYQTGYAGEAQLPEDDSESIAVPMPVLF